MKKSKNLFFLIGQLGIARFVNDGARFFCAIFRQDGKLVSVQLGKGDSCFRFFDSFNCLNNGIHLFRLRFCPVKPVFYSTLMDARLF